MKEEYDKRQRLAAAEAQLRKEREDHQREREELQQEREAQLRKEREEHQRERENHRREREEHQREREEHQREREVLQRQVTFTFLLNATNANMTHRYRMPRQEWNVFPKRWR